MDETATEIRFQPSRVEGQTGVREAAIFPDRLELVTDEKVVSVDFAAISRPQDPRFWPRLMSSIGTLIGRAPMMRDVADKDWFHEPPDRFFSFYTSPRIKVFMPTDEVEDYGPSYFFRIQSVMRAGGYSAFDLG